MFVLGSVHLSLVWKIVSSFILQSLKTSELRNIQTKKVSHLRKYKVCWSETIFSDFGPATFFQSNVRHSLDYKSLSVLINSNIASIHYFFTTLCPYKLLFYDVPIQ